MLRSVCATLAVLALASAAAAQDTPGPWVTFDFEGEAEAPVDPIEGLRITRSVELAPGVSGEVSIRVSRFAGAALSVVDLSPADVVGYGNRTLSPFGDAWTAAPIVIKVVSVPEGMGVRKITWDMGDFGGDADFATVLAETDDPDPDVPYGIDALQAAPPGGFTRTSTLVQREWRITSVAITCGSVEFPNSVFYDNFAVELSPIDTVTGQFREPPKTWIDFPEPFPDQLATGDYPTSETGGDEYTDPTSDGGPGGPPSDFDGLIAAVQDLGLPNGNETSLVSKVQEAADKERRGKGRGAVGSLKAFIREVEAQRGKRIDADDANGLVARATAIIANLE